MQQKKFAEYIFEFRRGAFIKNWNFKSNGAQYLHMMFFSISIGVECMVVVARSSALRLGTWDVESQDIYNL